MAGTEGTIPDTSTLSKSIKNSNAIQPKLLEADALALRQDPSLSWKELCWKGPLYGKARVSFSIFYRAGRDQIRSEGWRGLAKGNLLLFPKIFESAL